MKPDAVFRAGASCSRTSGSGPIRSQPDGTSAGVGGHDLGSPIGRAPAHAASGVRLRRRGRRERDEPSAIARGVRSHRVRAERPPGRVARSTRRRRSSDGRPPCRSSSRRPGFTRLMHHDGEPAVARVAGRLGIPYALSTLGTTSPEDVAARRARHRQVVPALPVERSRRGGRSRSPRSGGRLHGARPDRRHAGRRRAAARRPQRLHDPADAVRPDRRRHRAPSRLVVQPADDRAASVRRVRETQGTVADLINRVFDPTITIADLAWLREAWDGPIVIKGIQTPDDARAVVDAGADAIVISNHGGRQLDRAPTPLEQLPAIVAAVGDRAEVYIDGGILSGADVVAAVAMGARAVPRRAGLSVWAHGRRRARRRARR